MSAQCWVEGCSQRVVGETGVCAGHTWWAVWSDVADEHYADDSWWHEQLADYETQARQCVTATIAADWLSSRVATHELALLSIKALRRLPVVRDGRLVGIVSRRELIRAIRDQRAEEARLPLDLATGETTLPA